MLTSFKPKIKSVFFQKRHQNLSYKKNILIFNDDTSKAGKNMRKT